MSYRVRLYAFEDASDAQRRSAEQRFCRALETELGDAALVAPVLRVYRRLLALHGDPPSLEALSPDEEQIVLQWQAAEAAALTAAVGPHRHMGDAQFEIELD
jgi:hypothetical protein